MKTLHFPHRWLRLPGFGLLLVLLVVFILSGSTTPLRAQDSYQRIESDDPLVQRTGDWTPVGTGQDAYLLSSQASAASLSLAFEGRVLEVVYLAGPDFGSLAIEIDGQVVRTVDSSAETLLAGRLAAIDYLPAGRHTLRVYPVSGQIAIDAFRVQAVAGAPVDESGSGGDGLFIASQLSTSAALRDPAATLRHRAVTVDFGQLNREVDRLALNLFPGEVYTAVRDHVQPRPLGGAGYIWLGSVEGQFGSSVILVVAEDFVFLNVLVDGQTYNVMPAGGDLHLISERADAPEHPVTDALEVPEPSTLTPEAEAKGSGQDAAGSIDVLIVYNTPGLNKFASLDALIAASEAEIVASNQTFADSGVTTRYNLVGVEYVNYSDTSTSLQDHLVYLRGNGDGVMDEVHSLRNTFGADLVSLVTVATGGYAGIGYLLPAWCVSSGNCADIGFNAVHANYFSGSYVLAHELGHNLGNDHDADNALAAQYRAYPYSLGYRICGQFRTIMAYSSGCSGGTPRIARWSTPNLSHQGSPIGTSNANVVLSINNTDSIVANFRQSVVPQIPAASTPNSLIADSRTPTYKWTSSGVGNGFDLQIYNSGHSLIHNESYSKGDVCSGSNCAVTPDMNLSNGDYTWRVRATNGANHSLWTQEIAFEIMVVQVSISAPGGNTYSRTPVFTWGKAPDTEWYHLLVQTPGVETWLDKWIQPDCGGSNCTWAADVALGNAVGDTAMEAYVQPWGAGYGYGMWSNARSFSIVAPTQTDPSGGETVNNARPTYKWNKLSGVEWYQFYTGGPGGYSVLEWVASGDVCGSSVCSYRPAPPAQNGTHNWYVQAWGPAGLGPWSSGQSFVLNVSVPSVVGGRSPSDGSTISSPDVNLSWSHQSAASKYQVYVAGPGGVVLNDTLLVGEDISCGGSCTLPLEVTSNGDYQWYIRAGNAAGWGGWPDGGDWGGMDFTLNIPVPSQPVSGRQPTQGAVKNSALVTFKWDHDSDADRYELYVSGPGGVVFFDVVLVGADVSCGSTCSYEINLPQDGDYQWYMHAGSPVGWGPWPDGGDWGRIDFSVSTPAVPDVVSGRNPGNGATRTSQVVDFSWTHLSAATRYEIYLSGPNSYLLYTTLLVGPDLNCGSSCSYPVELGSNGDYTWYIRAGNGAGWGGWPDGGDWGARTFSLNVP